MAVQPIGAVTPLAGFSAVAPIGGLSAAGGSAGALGSASKTPGVNFADALDKVQQSIDTSDELSRQLATGELTDIHEYTVASSKAQLGVQLTVALRNQLLSAYQEVMRMQL
jgi:flagellar hook-basal body complex protein FliE